MANLLPNNARSAGLLTFGVLALILALALAVTGIALYAMQEVASVALIAVAVVFAVLGVRKLRA